MESLPSELLGPIMLCLKRKERRKLLALNHPLNNRVQKHPLLLQVEETQRSNDYGYLVSLVREGIDIVGVRGLLALHPEWLQKEGWLPLCTRSNSMLETLLELGANLLTPIDARYCDTFSLAYDTEEGGIEYYRNGIFETDETEYEPGHWTTPLHLLVMENSFDLTMCILTFWRGDLNSLDSEGYSPLHLLDASSLCVHLWHAAGARVSYKVICPEGISTNLPLEYRDEISPYLTELPSFHLEVNWQIRSILGIRGQTTNWSGREIDAKQYNLFAVRGLLITLIKVCAVIPGSVPRSWTRQLKPGSDKKFYTRSLRVSKVSTDGYDGSVSFLRYVISMYCLGGYIENPETDKFHFKLKFDECLESNTPRQRSLPISLPLDIRGKGYPKEWISCTEATKADYQRGIDLAWEMLLE